MPFYEYECSSCHQQTEVMQKISDAPLKKCPSCGKNKLTKLISAPVFRLKGAGWYETDFKSDGENKRNLVAEDAKEEPKAETKADDAKPAAKAEGKSESKNDGKNESKSDAKSDSAPQKKPEPKSASKSASKSKPSRKPAPKKAKRKSR